jgi:poly(U)-specific endoribonuclease
VDKERHHFEIADVTLPGGTGTTIVLPPNTMQLSNKGGEIRLVDRTGSTVHFVSYSKAQASREGETIVF